jgi:NAD+ synthase
MTSPLAVALCQINPVVGDIGGNIARIAAARETATRAHARLAVFSELVVCGYPPEDLVLKPFFLDRVEAGVNQLARLTADGGPALLVGAPWRSGGRLYNAALLLDGGTIRQLSFKRALPNYGVFDEVRVFAPGPLPTPMEVDGWRLGVMICEDAWSADVARQLAASGAAALVILNGSPFEDGKQVQRRQIVAARVGECELPAVYLNQVGGQDELVFDGASFVMDSSARLRGQLPGWEEAVAIIRLEAGGEVVAEGLALQTAENGDSLSDIYRALVLGLRDYVRKNGFPGVIIGLSGGIDSALSAAIAVDALGPEHVQCLMLPSPYTSQASLDDAQACADGLGVRLDRIAITPAMAAFDEMLDPLLHGLPPDETEENLQARIRGTALMALSNKLGYMVLSTGNKSEMSVGYATLYGDMCGGFSALKDIYKTTVCDLARWRNTNHPSGARGPAGTVVPDRIIRKPPTAELKPDQVDEDTLPPYQQLDDILACLIEGDMSIDDIAARGHDRAEVKRIWRLLDVDEYKRRQAPPGIKITRRAFGKERRYPITNAFKNLL